MSEFYSVANSIYVFIGGPEILVDLYPSHISKLYASRRCKRGIGSHTYGQNDHIGLKSAAIRKSDLYRIACLCERLDCCLKIKTHPLLQKMSMDNLSHGEIYRSHNLWCHLHYGNFCAGMAKILGHFQADESTTNNNRTLDISACHSALYHIRIHHIAQRIYTLGVYPRQRWTNRRGSG